MAGRIRDEDVALIRERSAIEAVVGDYLQLRGAGGNRRKALCPFHEEKTPSLHVDPGKGMFFCFGCGVGGDVITFVQRMEHLSFVDAVETLARRAGVELRYEQGGAAPGRTGGQRQRLLEAHVAAAEFFAERLSGPDAVAARGFLTERSFDPDTWARFGVGYAPASWDSLVRHLLSRGFNADELLAGGLAASGRQGPIDRFRGRLVWPIRDVKGDVIGFGARRLRDEDGGPKYLNTPDTLLYHKAHVLYGLDLAKAEIARRMQVVIVEGYTDVMACHLAGVPTAVATCGTAFGGEHVAVLRRLLMEQVEAPGRVIFTFDGDEAGRRAALRAFDLDQRFLTNTFVAVQPDGLDPCELRLRRGDAAVRDLVAGHVPLAEFVLRTTIGRFDLDTDEGRLAALDAAAPIVAALKEWGLRQRYAVSLDRWLGLMDEAFVLRRVAEKAGDPAPTRRGSSPRGDQLDPQAFLEREAVKLAVQRPALSGPRFDGLEADVFTSARYAAVRDAIAAAGGAGSAGAVGAGGERRAGGNGGPGEDGAWIARIQGAAADDTVRSLVTELALEALRSTDEDDPRYAESVLARVQELALTRRILAVKSRLQRLNPVEQTDDYNRLFGQLVSLEQRRRGLREQEIGAL